MNNLPAAFSSPDSNGRFRVNVKYINHFGWSETSVETDITKSKTFLRSVLEKIVIRGTTGTTYYKLPVSAQWKEKDEVVLPIAPLSGDRVTIGRTFELVFNLTI